MRLEVVKTDKGYVVIDNEIIPYNPDGGTNGNFLCLGEIEANIGHGVRPGDKQYVTPFVKNVGNCQSCRKIIATDTTFKLDGVPQFLLEKSDKVIYTEEQINPVIKFLKRIAEGADVNNYAWREANELLLTLEEPEKHLIAIEVDLAKSLHYDSYHNSYNKDYDKYIAARSYIVPATKEVFESWGKTDLRLLKSESFPDGILPIVKYIYGK